jgi:YidC/Oxa1 family membrane protein insertase
MEQFRMIIAIVLSMIVFLGYNFFFSDAPKKEETLKNNVSFKDDKRADADHKGLDEITKNGKISSNNENLSNISERSIALKGSLYSIVISTRGGLIKSFKLADFRESIEKDSLPKELIDRENTIGTLIYEFRGDGTDLQQAIFTCDLKEDRIEIFDKPFELSLAWISKDGLKIEKKYRFSPNSYLIEFDVIVSNQTEKAVRGRATLSLINSAKTGQKQYGFEGPSALIDNKVEEFKSEKINEKKVINGKIGWIALQDRYFLNCIIPRNIEDAAMELDMKEHGLVESKWIQAESVLAGGEQRKTSFDLYLGPKKISVLKSFGNGLDRAVDFGWFDFIARPCLWFMNLIYQFIPNYGIVIIVLTILIKIVLWPLGQKSYKSMNQMKRLQPLMTEIREKYKNDKNKMNAETMALYRTYKVNPLGGCLPMVAQIPVFFAFYRMLYEAIELRHAPFLGWINDLSAPDRLFHFNVASIPFMDPPYGIPVLTVIMGATMFIQQKMQPPMGDPAQAKMMMFMPIIFTFIFINFSSGLVLYWLVNNVLSIAQQHFVSKKTA